MAGSGVTAIGLTLKLSSRITDGSMLIDGSGSNMSVFVLVLSKTSLFNKSLGKLIAAGSINVFVASKVAVVEVQGIEMVTAAIEFAVVGSILGSIGLVEVIVVTVVVVVEVVVEGDGVVVEVVVVEGDGVVVEVVVVEGGGVVVVVVEGEVVEKLIIPSMLLLRSFEFAVVGSILGSIGLVEFSVVTVVVVVVEVDVDRDGCC